MISFTCPDCDEEMEIAERMVGRKVECVGCGKKVVVPEEEVEEVEEERPVTKKRRKKKGASRDDLKSVAMFQKIALVSLGLNFLLAIAIGFVPPALVILFQIGLITGAIAISACLFMLAMKLFGLPAAIICCFLGLIPLVGFVVLLIVNSKATSFLQLNGVSVGLFGASLSEFD